MEAIGAPFIRPLLVEFQREISNLNLEGVGFRTIVHVPWDDHLLTEYGGSFQGQPTFGLQLHIYDFAEFNAAETAVALLVTMRRLFPEHMNSEVLSSGFNQAVGNTWVAEMILEGASIDQIMEEFQRDLDNFNEMQLRNLLY